MLPNQRPFYPAGDIWPGPEIFLVIILERGGGVGAVTEMWWVEAADTVKHPTTRRKAATTKSCSAPNTSGAGAENPCVRRTTEQPL